MPADVETYSRIKVNPGKTEFMLEHGEQGTIVTFSHSSLSSPGLPSRAHPRALLISTDESKETIILARVGVSFISAAQACANAEAEIPDIDFDRVKEDARKEWAELLGRFGIEMKERASVKMRCCLTCQ